MKVVMAIDKNSLSLLSDPLNREIIKELIFNERSISGLADLMNVSTVNIWRRILKMQSTGLIRQTKVEKIRNLEKKYYRAAAMLFVPQQIIDIEPKSKNLKHALTIYSGIQMKMLKELMKTDVPDETKNLTDLAMIVQLKKFVETFLDENTVQELKLIRELLA